jgi:LPS export ABC transporter protein LptC
MKNSSMKFRTLVQITLIVIISGTIISCENKTDLPKFEFLSLPSVTGKDFETVLSDSGMVQVIMSSPLMERYDNKDFPYTEFRSGIKVVSFNGKKKPSGSVTAKYAKFTKNDNLWELKDSVVVVDENNVKLETELLYWNQEKDLIYTDKFVKITDSDQIMQGFGLKSDSHLIHRRILKPTGTFYINDEK